MMITPGFELRHIRALANADSWNGLTAAVRRDQNNRKVTVGQRQQLFNF